MNLNTQQMRMLWRSVWQIPELVAAVTFSSQIMGESHSGQLKNEAPLMIHRAGNIISDLCRTTDLVHVYDTAKSTNFVLPGHKDYEVAAAGVAHTRSLGFLRKHLGGPIFDLEAIWDEHTLFEFGERDVEKTMGTMVEEPYVNHVPTVSSLIFDDEDSVLKSVY
jgi:carboxymethylenebutenolidase